MQHAIKHTEIPRIDMHGGIHVRGSSWDILPTSYVGQWDRIDTYVHVGLTCVVVHMGVPGISYHLCRTV